MEVFNVSLLFNQDRGEELDPFCVLWIPGNGINNTIRRRPVNPTFL